MPRRCAVAAPSSRMRTLAGPSSISSPPSGPTIETFVMMRFLPRDATYLSLFRSTCYSWVMQSGEPKTPPAGAGRANQKLRTRNAIVRPATDMMRTGRDVTMLEVAKAALVSEATAYRYFPDLVSLLQEAMAGQMPTPAEALESVAGSRDPVERVAAATEHLLRTV